MDISQLKNTKFKLSDFYQIKSDSNIICYGFSNKKELIHLNINHIVFGKSNFFQINNSYFQVDINYHKNFYFIFHQGYLAAFPIKDYSQFVIKNNFIKFLRGIKILNFIKRNYFYLIFKYFSISFLFFLKKFGLVNFKIFYPNAYYLKVCPKEFDKYPEFKKFYN